MASLFARGGKATNTLIGINLIVFLAQLASGGNLTAFLALYPGSVAAMPWTIITSGFAHSTSNLLHIGLNMYSLWLLGRSLEPIVGTRRFVIIYLAAIVGGSIAFILFNPNDFAVGASGGIFGLMGAYFVVIRALGFRPNQILGVIAVNLVIGFLMPGIAISAHIGGLVAGSAVAWYFTKARR